MDVAFRDPSRRGYQSRQSHMGDLERKSLELRGTNHERPGSGQSGPPLPDSELLVHENASLLSLVEHQQQCISALRCRVSVAEREKKSLKDEVSILREALAASNDEIVAMSAQVDEVSASRIDSMCSVLTIFGLSVSVVSTILAVVCSAFSFQERNIT